MLQSQFTQAFKLSAFALLITGLWGCNASKDQTNIEVLQSMMDQPSIKAQDWDPKNPNKTMMMTPPKGTVPRGFKPYLIKNIQQANRLKAPKGASAFDPAFLKRGQKQYQIYCKMCHGLNGAGDGLVAKAMSIKPPALISAKLRRSTDGYFFHVITKGYGVMGAHASQIKDPMDRWAIIKYVRYLQKLNP